ncbi:hypothetical protein ACFWA4_00185 [Streptomyces sp. NPDC060011]|uniref:hypothetical protein n=1 Tax=Streptomyces sp. NPDC060011 TaxID=3347037 RepID=UPI0036B5447A
MVDHEATNLDDLISGLNLEMDSNRILHPFVWGRELYDKAFETLQHNPTSLDEKETAQLLADTPRGVFQSFDMVTGPLGILLSQEMRPLAPTIRLPLYHCEKRSCRIIHHVQLMTSDSQIHKTRAKTREILGKEWGEESAFGEFFSEIDNEFCGFFDDRGSLGEVPLLGECFSSEELNAVITTALRGKASPLRHALQENKIRAGSPDDFANSLDKASKIQVLMLMKRKDLTACIDETIHRGDIKIPEHEIRRPKIWQLSTGYYNLSAECSQYGFRTVPQDRSLAVVRLVRLIASIYDLGDTTSSKELAWKLRRVEGKSTKEKLDHFVRGEDPAEVLRSLVLGGPGSFSIAAAMCGLPESLEVEQLDDAEIINILLWKLGFNAKSPDEAFGPLRRNRETFARAVTSATSFGDTERYEIKRESSPLFSSIEAALDATLAFATWALTFDHWAAPSRFTYHHSDARVQMAKILNSADARHAHKADDATIYDSQGRNTLFPLISGFARLQAYLSQTVEVANQCARPESEMPAYAKLAELTPFSFVHTLPFLDLESENQESIISNLSEMTRTLESGGVSNVRNRLQHSRDDFPSKEELIKFLSAIDEFLELAEKSGLCPMIFRPAGNYRDSFGRATYRLQDYRGREYSAQRPSGTSSPGMPGLVKDQFVIPAAKLKSSGEVLRFHIGTMSAYTEIWEDWPKYRAAVDRSSEFAQSTEDVVQIS